MGLFDGTPHWTDSPGDYSLKSEAAAAHIGSLFLGGMQLAQQRDQQQQVMAQRIKEFGAQEETRQLQNKVLQSKLDADASDAKALADWWPSFISAKGDALHDLPIPLLRDPSRLAQIEQVVAGRINIESGSSAERLKAAIRSNAVSGVGKLHADFQGPAWDILEANDGMPNSEFNEYLGFATTESERLAEESKLRLFTAEEEQRRKTRLAVFGDKRIQHVGSKIVKINDDGSISELFDATGIDPLDRSQAANAYRIIYNVNATEDEKAKAQADVDAIRAKKGTAKSAAPASAPEVDLDAEASEILLRPVEEGGLSDAEVVELLKAPKGKVTTKTEFDALPSGAVYIGEDGRKYRKP